MILERGKEYQMSGVKAVTMYISLKYFKFNRMVRNREESFDL
jgi:hypothetical protein